MILHKTKDDFKDLIEVTANHFRMLPAYIEKDYWVCYVLKRLANSNYVDNIVFKGGTSLSKAYGIIERFSEDIDLQLINYSGTENRKKGFIKEIETEIAKGLNCLNEDPRTSKHGRIRKTVYSYGILYDDVVELLPASKELILEINSMSTPEPFEKRKIRTYIADFLYASNQSQYIKVYELEDIEINVLDKRRTFVEKIFAVMDFSFRDRYIDELSTNVRHLYDIHKLYNDTEIKSYFQTDNFYKMASRVVVENDFFGCRAKTKYSESKLFDVDILNEIRKTYNNEFSKLVFGVLPSFNLIKNDMGIIISKIRTWENEHRIFDT